MASKKQNKLIFNIDLKCNIKINLPQRDKFEADLRRGELYCGAEFRIDDLVVGFNIYSNQISGGIACNKIDDETHGVSASGKYVARDDWNNLPKIRQIQPTPLLMLTYICDSDGKSHHINGDEDATCPMGTFFFE